jgi:hypothetical protein
LLAGKGEWNKVELADKLWLGGPLEDVGDGEEFTVLVETAHVIPNVGNQPLAVGLGLQKRANYIRAAMQGT